MRHILTLLLLLLLLPAVAQAQAVPRAVYLSSAPGADDANPGSQAQPWRTLDRLQQALPSLRPGDQVLFERGSIFSGALVLDGLAGAADNPILFAAYGAGEPPVFTDLEPLTDWVSLGRNRWSAVCRGCTAAPNHLLLDGATQPLARYPNLDEADEGYLYFDSAIGRTSITDDALNGQDWTGGELVVRSIAWVLDRLPIQSHRGAVLTAGLPANYDLTVGYGYFIQNHPAALDRDGEWTYDSASRRITLYLSSSPGARRVQVTTRHTLWALRNVQHLTLRDLAFHGGSEFALDITNCLGVTMQGVQALYSGGEALRASGCTALEITASRLAHALNFGLRLWDCRDCRVADSVIEHIATFAGLGKNSDGQYNGVQFDGSNSVFERNIVRYTGYIGINFGGSVTIQHNDIRYFNRVKVDGGGIYGWRQRGARIIGNTVLYGDGSDAGIPWDGPATHGIYIDDNSEDIEVRGNIVGYMGSSGIFLHNTRNVRVVDNLIFGAREQGILLADDDLGTYNVESSWIENNQVFGVGAQVAGVALQTNKDESTFLGQVGTLRNNLYCSPTTDALVRLTLSQGGWRSLGYSLAGWQARTGQEAGSAACSLRLPALVETGTLGPNQIANNALAQDSSGWVRWPEDQSTLDWDARQGGSLRFAHTGTVDAVYAYHVIGPVTAGTLYRVTLTGLTDGGEVSLVTTLSRQGDDYGWLSSPANVIVDADPRAHTLYLRPDSSYANARLNIILPRGAPPVWLDEITVTPVTGRPLTLEDVARFEINPSPSALPVTLSEDYTDLTGAVYPAGSSLTLPPYSARILLRQSPAAARPGDLDGDGAVTLRDFGLLAASYNRMPGQPGYDPRADLTQDGAVTLADFGLLAAHFNT